MACTVAKNMGLQRISDAPQDTERANVFWTLYIMDKERTFMSGIPCEIYLFDSDIRLSEQGIGSTVPRYQIALIHMMSLWEEIHIVLYSSRIGRESISRNDDKVLKLHTRLAAWGYKYADLLSNSQKNGPLFPYLRQELKYVFHVSQILVHRCGNSETSRQRSMSSARAALKILKEIHGTSLTLRGAALLRR